jgi:hypothetical protein
MRTWLALCVAAIALVLLSSAAAAAGPQNQFAVGSGKADALVGLQHLSFSAHNIKFPPNPCAASGSIVYDTPTMHLKADVTDLVIEAPGYAWFQGPVMTATDGSGAPIDIGGMYASVSVFDGESVSTVGDVTPDSFVFEGLFPPSPCRAPSVFQEPVASGNIVVKTTGPLALP